MMNSSRDTILNKLRAKQRPEPERPIWQTKRQFDDLAERFTQSLMAVKGQVHRASSWDAALETVDELLTELNAQQVVVNDEAPLNTVDFATTRPQLEWFTAGKTAGDLRAFCTTADVGLSSCEAALAETGTVIVASGMGKSRLVTLLPPVHIALVPTSKLTTDIFTWTAARGEAPPANVSLVSGPSKTADIEQTMAIGVHGPKQFIVVLYDD